MSIADKLQTIAENEQKVFEAGAKSEYDRFWDNFQQNGNRTRYVYGFAGICWTKETLKPKYPIKAEEGFRGCQCMFRDCNWNNPELIDYSLIKDKIDFSKCTMASETFCCAWIDNIDVDFSNCEQLSQTFATNDNGNMPHIRLKVSEKAVFDRTFWYNSSTKELIFTNDSVIGQNGLDLHWNTMLSHDSIASIVNALSTTTSGLTVTLSKTAVDTAFATSEGSNDGSTSNEWTTLIATKSNWNISLV